MPSKTAITLALGALLLHSWLPAQAQPAQSNGSLIDLSAPDAPLPTDIGNHQPTGVSTNTKSLKLPPNIPASAATSNSADNSNGPRFSERISRSHEITEGKKLPSKIQIMADDPDSGWWETNVRRAFARSQQEMKPMLLLFSSIHPPHRELSLALSEQVFATKSFNNYVKEHLVICFLDYPKKNIPASLERAKKDFKVAGLPTLLVFNPWGDVERSLRGYRKDRPVDYFNELKSSCKPAIERIQEEKQRLNGLGYRDWHAESGKHIFAQFLRRDDYLMTLKDCRGLEFTIAIKNLTAEDRKLARSFPRLDQVARERGEF